MKLLDSLSKVLDELITHRIDVITDGEWFEKMVASKVTQSMPSPESKDYKMLKEKLGFTAVHSEDKAVMPIFDAVLLYSTGFLDNSYSNNECASFVCERDCGKFEIFYDADWYTENRGENDAAWSLNYTDINDTVTVLGSDAELRPLISLVERPISIQILKTLPPISEDALLNLLGRAVKACEWIQSEAHRGCLPNMDSPRTKEPSEAITTMDAVGAAQDVLNYLKWDIPSFISSAETNPAFWDCDCKENYIHSKAVTQGCSSCGFSEEDSPDSRASEVTVRFTPEQIAILKDVAKPLIDDGSNVEYCRGISELIADFDPQRDVDQADRANQILIDLLLPVSQPAVLSEVTA